MTSNSCMQVHKRHQEERQALVEEHTVHVQGLLSTIAGLEDSIKDLGAKPADLAHEVGGLQAELAIMHGKSSCRMAVGPTQVKTMLHNCECPRIHDRNRRGSRSTWTM
jgi:hypothetical protein